MKSKTIAFNLCIKNKYNFIYLKQNICDFLQHIYIKFLYKIENFNMIQTIL